jgi:hypothetical protein
MFHFFLVLLVGGERIVFFLASVNIFFVLFSKKSFVIMCFFSWQVSNRKYFFDLLGIMHLHKPLSVNDLRQNDPEGVASM